MSRNKLYILLSAACVLGYSWLGFLYFRGDSIHHDPGVCLFRQFTSIPCPSCGSTRAILTLIHGEFIQSLNWNPFGVILMLIMLISPVWILCDIMTQKSSLLMFYNKAELYLKRRYIAFPLIFIVLANWVWNIAKGL
jgi:hypothetical protein